MADPSAASLAMLGVRRVGVSAVETGVLQRAHESNAARIRAQELAWREAEKAAVSAHGESGAESRSDSGAVSGEGCDREGPGGGRVFGLEEATPYFSESESDEGDMVMRALISDAPDGGIGGGPLVTEADKEVALSRIFKSSP